uniref:X protein n=1 Tax=Human parvovirus B19 TaxID=10798 RepID=A1BML5_PAVHB|nr:X protein [Human parvovirus B19]
MDSYLTTPMPYHPVTVVQNLEEKMQYYLVKTYTSLGKLAYNYPVLTMLGLPMSSKLGLRRMLWTVLQGFMTLGIANWLSWE